jgi:uncharacterized metal-binding protein
MDWVDQHVLNYDLFAADRDSDVRILDNRMLKTRRPHRCVICEQSIPVGARVRAQTECDRQARRVMTFYVCEDCCAAIDRRLKDDGRAIETRTAIGMGAMP